MNNNSRLSLIFLKIPFEKCQAKLNFKFKVTESHGFLSWPRFSNDKSCRKVANQNDTLIAIETFVPGSPEHYTCMWPQLCSKLLIEMGRNSLLSNENWGIEEVRGQTKSQQLLAELGPGSRFFDVRAVILLLDEFGGQDEGKSLFPQTLELAALVSLFVSRNKPSSSWGDMACCSLVIPPS